MCLGFSKLLGTLSCGKICIYLLRIHYKKDQKKTYLMMIMWFFLIFLYKGICCGYSFELHWQVNAIQMSTHNICLYKVDKKYTGCNLKTTELLDCALIGVYAVIRSNVVTCLCESSGRAFALQHWHWQHWHWHWWSQMLVFLLTLVLLRLGKPCLYKQCRSSVIELFAIKYVNLYQQSRSSNLIGWKIEMGMAS